MIRKSLLLAGCLLLGGCAALLENIPFVGKKEVRAGGVYKENLDQERIVDLVIVKKLTGKKKFAFFDEFTAYLEGYIRGVVVDYDDHPIEGIVVRVTDKGKDVPGFDPGVSDANGVYRIRFSQPIKKNIIDVKASMAYNPPWQQQLDVLGAALEPQTKESAFRLYYNKKLGIIGIGEDLPKTIARKVTGASKEGAPDSKGDKTKADKKTPPPPAPPAAPKKPAGDDFFGDFGN